MLNVSAKEFVPAASPCGAAVGAAAATPKPERAGDGAAKAQLSPKAPEFVPRGAVADAASDPPRSVLDPPHSTRSSSVLSREADGCWGYIDADGDEQPCAAGLDEETGGYEYYCGGDQRFEGCGYGGTSVAHGGELAPEEAYDTYNYGAYDGYGMPYSDVGATVYYDTAVYEAASASTAYDSYQQGCASYCWDKSAGAYGYGADAHYGGEYGGWQQYDGSADGVMQHHPVTDPADAAAADSELSLEAGLAALAIDDGSGNGVAPPVGEEQLRALARADAAELLEMFFPHYDGEALSRLLDRTGGDLLAAFSELAAMERQVGAERAAAGGKGRGGGGRGGRSPAAAGRPGGGKRSGGGGAAAFKLDPEAFPSLSPAPPQAAKAAVFPVASSSPAPAEAAGEGEGEQPDGDLLPPATATATISEPTTTAPGSASTFTAPPASPAKPNFAALLRNSPAATSSPSAAASALPSDQHQRPSQSQRVAGATPGDCSSSRGGAGAASRTARGPAAASSSSAVAGAVPWVSTGEAVAAQYAEERREAAMLARARNQFFQQATLAYLSGNKALAKQLGRKGREMNDAMKAAHAAAARRIFAARNAANQQGNGNGLSQSQSRRQQGRQLQQQQGARPPAASGGGAKAQAQGGDGSRQQQQGAGGAGPDAMFVDLHGLHAAEAVAALEAQIAEARAAGCRFLRVCTGTGHHTKGAKTPVRLPAAVTDTLLANHLTFKTLKPGLLEAQL